LIKKGHSKPTSEKRSDTACLLFREMGGREMKAGKGGSQLVGRQSGKKWGARKKGVAIGEGESVIAKGKKGTRVGVQLRQSEEKGEEGSK